jgi:molecular chaperone GrpE (heat shock protein)
MTHGFLFHSEFRTSLRADTHPARLSAIGLEAWKAGALLPAIVTSRIHVGLLREWMQSYRRLRYWELKVIFGIEPFDPEHQPVPIERLTELLRSFLSVEVCRRYGVLPLNYVTMPLPYLVVGMVDPSNASAIADLNRWLKPQKLAWQRRVLWREDFQLLFSAYLDEEIRHCQAQTPGRWFQGWRLKPPAVEPHTADPTALETELTQLRQRVHELEQQQQIWLAERERYRKPLELPLKSSRSDSQFPEQQRQRLRQQGKREVILELLATVDAFEQAQQQVTDADADSALHRGYQQIHRLLLNGLKRSGVVTIEPAVGEPFNPLLHEAIQVEATVDRPPGMILAVLQRGYQLTDDIIRPAQVTVSIVERQ